MDDLRACFSDPELLPYDLEACGDYWGSATCVVEQGLSANREPYTCNTIGDEAATDCCNQGGEDAFALSGEAQQVRDNFNTLLESLDQSCPNGLEVTFQSTDDCEVSGDPEYIGECLEGTRLTAPDNTAEFELEIDPSLSFVDADLGAETVFSPLEGVAYAATAPKRFLVALAWGDDFEYDDDDFTHNHVVLSAELELSGSGGSYAVPLNQDFALSLQGYRGVSEYNVAFEPTNTSGGVFDVSGGVWSYDYAETGPGTSMEVHLEGSLLSLVLP